MRALAQEIGTLALQGFASVEKDSFRYSRVQSKWQKAIPNLKGKLLSVYSINLESKFNQFPLFYN
jgi:hypothetical protein